MELTNMNSWIKDNAVSIAIALVTMVSTYAIYGYRIGALEVQAQQMQETINTSNQVEVQIQISLAHLQSDTQYIKEQVTAISSKQN